jgi:hypothetical protein
MANYQLHLGTQAAFDAKKLAGTLVANDLYFIEDSQVVYMGEKLLSAAAELVSSFPAAGVQGKIYINSDSLEAKVWNGAEWTVISPAVSTTLNTDTAAGALVTASAIRAYVSGAVGNDGLVADVTYAADTAVLTVAKADGSSTTINLPKENFLSSAAYDSTTHILTMTLVDDTKVTVNLEELIDVYTAGNTATVNMGLKDGQFTADVNLSKEANNALVAKEDGLHVDISGKQDNLSEAQLAATNSGATKTKIDAYDTHVADTTIHITAAERTAWNAKADASDVYTKSEVDTELAKKADASSVYAKSETYTQTEVDDAIEASHTWLEI